MKILFEIFCINTNPLSEYYNVCIMIYHLMLKYVEVKFKMNALYERMYEKRKKKEK